MNKGCSCRGGRSHACRAPSGECSCCMDTQLDEPDEEGVGGGGGFAESAPPPPPSINDFARRIARSAHVKPKDAKKVLAALQVAVWADLKRTGKFVIPNRLILKHRRDFGGRQHGNFRLG